MAAAGLSNVRVHWARAEDAGRPKRVTATTAAAHSTRCAPTCLATLSSLRPAHHRHAGQDARLRQRHDVAIARAVAELRVLSELCLPLVRPGGHWVAAKGPVPDAEVAGAGSAITKLGGKLLGVQEVDSGEVGGGGGR